MLTVLEIYAHLYISFIVIVRTNYANVSVLTDFNFTDKIKNYEVALIKFYVPWCGHCMKFAPEFEEASEILKTVAPSVALLEVDCSEEGKEVCHRNGVKGYPTVKVFRHGKFEADYMGPRHAAGIVQHMRTIVKRGSVELKTVAEADAFLSADDNCVLGFFDQAGSTIEEEFHKVANALSYEYRFAHSYRTHVYERYDYRNEIILFRAYRLQTTQEPSQLKYEGEVTLYKLRSWIAEHYHGLVGVRTALNIEQFRRPLIVVYYKLDFTGKKKKETSYWRNRVMIVAKKFATPGARKMHFAVSDAGNFSAELNDLGVSYVNDTPVVVARDSSERRFVMQQPLTVDNLEQFVEHLLIGKLHPYIKSAPLPHANDGLIQVVVGRTFDDVVNDASKDVLIFFHSSWCEECPGVSKKLQKVAKKLKSNKRILLGAMDAVVNDVPKQYVIKRFPSIFFAAKKSKMFPKLYEGKYEVDDMMKFIAEEASETFWQDPDKTDVKNEL